MPRLRLRHVLLLAALILIALLARPVLHLARTAWQDTATPLPAAAAGQWRDAGGIEDYPVRAVRPLPNDEAAALALLQASFAEARAAGQGVSLAGARHSMGGQSAARDGIVIDMSGYTGARYDEARGTVSVRAGTRWSEVIRTLEPYGKSVAVMQSNSIFSIGGSISVNAHGWQPLFPPVAGSVIALRVVTADGRLLHLSREENPELFGLVLGGYGLFGVILEAELKVVPNQAYRVRREFVPVADYAALFAREVAAAPERSGLAYGRISVAPSQFLRASLLTVFRPEAAAVPIPPLAADSPPSRLSRLVFRGQVGSDYGKELRWNAERLFGEQLLRPSGSRNQILDEDIRGFDNHDAASTDLLQEYFVPRESLGAFVDAAREILRDSGTDLLNITVRDIAEDKDSFLRYADRDMFGLVLLFHVSRDAAGDARLRAVGERLLDAALAQCGRHYLPYRLYARTDQFHRAYPQARRFFALKRQYDPDGVLSNELYRRYGSD
jgi:FAD/FMN-containing dehydrogenase